MQTGDLLNGGSAWLVCGCCFCGGESSTRKNHRAEGLTESGNPLSARFRTAQECPDQSQGREEAI